MAEASPIIHDSINDEAIYTPSEISQIAKCSASYVRQEIQRGNLKAFRFGERMIRIKGNEARQWIGKFMDTDSRSLKAGTAQFGTRVRSVADTAFLSVRADRAQKV